MEIPVLDTVIIKLSNILGTSPGLTVLILGSGIALLPLLRKGQLDDRLEAVKKNMGYTELILAGTAFLSLYYSNVELQFKLVDTIAGFILGFTILRWYDRLTSQ